MFEAEAGSGLALDGLLDRIDHAVGRASTPANHGKRPVTHRIDRSEATWLIARRMQKNICASEKAMGKWLFVTDTCGNLPRIACGDLPEMRFIVGVAFSCDSELAAFRKESGQSLQYDIGHLLVGKSARESKERRLDRRIEHQ